MRTSELHPHFVVVKPSCTYVVANALCRFPDIIESTWVLGQTIDVSLFML